jgi:branched-subunit amino acid transport protein
MGELWRKASELFWGKPLLWLPVLVADLLGSGLDQGQKAIVRSIVMGKMVYHSALGGTVEHVPLTAAAVQQATQVAIPLQWTSNFLRILLYVVALVLTAFMVRDLLKRNPEPWKPGAALRGRVGGIFGVALLVLAVTVVFTVLFSWGNRWLLTHGHKAVAVSPWYHVACAVLLVGALAWVAAPTAVRTVSLGPISKVGAQRAVAMGFLLGVATVALAFFVEQSAPALIHQPDARRIPLEMVASLVTAVPYILLFLGFGVLAVQEDSTRMAESES